MLDKRLQKSTEGAFAVIYGHTYVCRDCQRALTDAGVKWLID
jgi:deoxycytidylate deaminase